MIKDQWAVELENKSVPELLAQFEEYDNELQHLYQIKEDKAAEGEKFTPEEGRRFHTISYRSVMIKQELEKR